MAIGLLFEAKQQRRNIEVLADTLIEKILNSNKNWSRTRKEFVSELKDASVSDADIDCDRVKQHDDLSNRTPLFQPALPTKSLPSGYNLLHIVTELVLGIGHQWTCPRCALESAEFIRCELMQEVLKERIKELFQSA